MAVRTPQQVISAAPGPTQCQVKAQSAQQGITHTALQNRWAANEAQIRGSRVSHVTQLYKCVDRWMISKLSDKYDCTLYVTEEQLLQVLHARSCRLLLCISEHLETLMVTFSVCLCCRPVCETNESPPCFISILEIFCCYLSSVQCLRGNNVDASEWRQLLRNKIANGNVNRYSRCYIEAYL